MPNDNAVISKITIDGKSYDVVDEQSHAAILELKKQLDDISSGGSEPESSLEFSTHFNFPNIGEPDKLYIATDENAIYRFDESTLTYVYVSGTGTGVSNTDIIQISLNNH